MVGNPLVPQGLLNRILASVIWSDFPDLNVTASFLGEEMTRLSLNGPGATRIGTATGQVASPEPFIPVTLRINLLKSQVLADAYKRKMESSVMMGDCTVRPDAVTLSPYQLRNCSLGPVEPLEFNGKSAGWIISVDGYYLINSSLWG